MAVSDEDCVMEMEVYWLVCDWGRKSEGLVSEQIDARGAKLLNWALGCSFPFQWAGLFATVLEYCDSNYAYFVL